MEAQLAKEVKAFRKQFKKDHGRDPSRKDMNRYPGVAATYDAWLAIKSSQSASTSAAALPSKAGSINNASSGTTTSTKRKSMPTSPHRGRGEQFTPVTAMGPPPTTPSKKKLKSTMNPDLFRTPTKKAAASPASGSVHDSGGSIVDVPLTPKQAYGSPSLDRKHQHQVAGKSPYASPSGRMYEDGTSPSKLRALLSSFSSIHRTPSKKKRAEEERDADDVLMERLTRNAAAIPSYTPRTKARKRLRGEVVITPEKVRQEQQRTLDAGKEGGGTYLSSEPVPLRKKRRGMAASTLKDYGIVPVVRPRSKEAGGHARAEEEKTATTAVVQTALTDANDDDSNDVRAEEDDDDDFDMLGPSPSTVRMVDRHIKAFKPLFGVEANGNFSDDDGVEEGQAQGNEKEDGEDFGMASADVPHPAAATPPSELAKKSEGDDDEEDVVVVPYQRYSHRQHLPLRHQYDGEDSDDEDQITYYGLGAALDQSVTHEEEARMSEEDDDAPILDSLSLNSPQCKKARHKMRIKAEKEVRLLLGAEQELEALDWEEEKRDSGGGGGVGGATLPTKTNKVGPPIKAGKLRKGFKDVQSAVGSGAGKAGGKPKSSAAAAAATTTTSLILQNSRDQIGSDQDSDYDHQGDQDDDDEWASDVSSADYGLGDGYMSDTADTF